MTPRSHRLAAAFIVLAFYGDGVAPGSAQVVAAPPLAGPKVIQVDGACRILNVDLRDPAFGPPKHPYSSHVCNVESEKTSQRWEQDIAVNGAPKNRLVNIHEKDFVVHNPYSQVLTFIILQPVPKKFHIDSPPPPTEMENSVATFKIIANPDETVRFHVGWRD